MRAHLRASTPVIIVLCLTLAGCGDEGPSATDPPPPPPRAGAGTGLGLERFRALDRMYVAALGLDRIRGDGALDRAKIDAASAPVLAACRTLDRDDRLLEMLRRSCALTPRLTDEMYAVSTCRGGAAQTCRRQIARARSVLRSLLQSSRRLAELLAELKISRDCRAALRTPALAEQGYSGLGRGLALLDRALREASPADARESERVLTDAAAKLARVPTARAALDRFRDACA